MQFLVDRDLFLEVLAKLAVIVDPKSGIPILHNIYLEARVNQVLMRATDTDLQLAMPCPAEVTEQGQITVDGRLLHDIVRKCPKGGQIGVTLGGKPKRRKASADDANRLRLTSGRAEFALLTIPADDWPLLGLPYDAASFNLECRQLRALIEKTRFAISSDQTRYYLGGIYLHANGETLAAVATDGHRLAVKTVPLPAGADDMPAPRGEADNPGPRAAGDDLAAMRGVIIPKDAAAAALKILPDSEVECELAVSANLMRLGVGEVELISKLIDGTYPDWQRVVPAGGVGRVIAPRGALLQAVARVGVVLDEKHHAIKITFVGEAIDLTSHSHVAGHSARELVEDCVADAGTSGRAIGVNPRYLAEALETMDGTQIAIVLQEAADGPLLFEEVDGDGSLRMLVMPVRVPVAGMAAASELEKAA